METLIKNEIISLHRQGNEAVKTFLQSKYGEELFKSATSWMEVWKQFCKDHSIDLTLPYPSPHTPDEEYIDAQFMMMHIIRKLRTKKPDFDNSNEPKYFPYFDMRSSGFGFSASYYDFWYSGTSVGSRLCISNDRALSIRIAKDFLPIYEKIMVEP
jgi:hypothetical protein